MTAYISRYGPTDLCDHPWVEVSIADPNHDVDWCMVALPIIVHLFLRLVPHRLNNLSPLDILSRLPHLGSTKPKKWKLLFENKIRINVNLKVQINHKIPNVVTPQNFILGSRETSL
jgi:hypothetical protein